MSPAITGLEKPVSAYLRDNVHYTFSGFNFLPTFLDLLLEVGVDRIMFSTGLRLPLLQEQNARLRMSVGLEHLLWKRHESA